MAGFRDEIEERIQKYGDRYGLAIRGELGFGWDGIVFSTRLPITVVGSRLGSAIKGFRHERLYQRERDVYLRLQAHSVNRVGCFNVPELIRCDDELWIVEMSIVSPPFVLDFAGAYLDQAPDYPADVMSDWLAEKQEQFGERWSEVAGVMTAFRHWGVWLADVKPGNVEFAEER